MNTSRKILAVLNLFHRSVCVWGSLRHAVTASGIRANLIWDQLVRAGLSDGDSLASAPRPPRSLSSHHPTCHHQETAACACHHQGTAVRRCGGLCGCNHVIWWCDSVMTHRAVEWRAPSRASLSLNSTSLVLISEVKLRLIGVERDALNFGYISFNELH